MIFHKSTHYSHHFTTVPLGPETLKFCTSLYKITISILAHGKICQRSDNYSILVYSLFQHIQPCTIVMGSD